MTSEKTVRVSKQFAQNIHNTGIESKNVSTASNNMSMRIQKIFGKVKITNSNTKQISDTSEQIASNIQQLSEALDLMNLSMKSVSENADKGSNISKKAVEMAEQAKNSIKNLEEASNEIGDVIRVIMKISDKTNLLALNAAIEAAAAGEAGKGFAVVSSAIQKFADQSALAAENISSRITSLQENAMNTIIVIMEITDIIQVMNDSISNIKISVYNQSAASDQISANALGVKEKSDQIAQKLAELSKAFDQTTHDIDYLSKESDQVSSSIQAVSRQTDDSSNEISQLNHITNQLDELSNDLHQQVDVFKI
jgi:methyl-accepting chemotaxis protein